MSVWWCEKCRQLVGGYTTCPACGGNLSRAVVSPLDLPPDRVVEVELEEVVTNPDDMKQGNVSYVGTRKSANALDDRP